MDVGYPGGGGGGGRGGRFLESPVRLARLESGAVTRDDRIRDLPASQTLLLLAQPGRSTRPLPFLQSCRFFCDVHITTSPSTNSGTPSSKAFADYFTLSKETSIQEENTASRHQDGHAELYNFRGSSMRTCQAPSTKGPVTLDGTGCY